jgi:hypothetical protein
MVHLGYGIGQCEFNAWPVRLPFVQGAQVRATHSPGCTLDSLEQRCCAFGPAQIEVRKLDRPRPCFSGSIGGVGGVGDDEAQDGGGDESDGDAR